jgi:GNAT superfamily N-acetyltransferase
MYVVPDARGQRVGRLLLHRVEDLATSYGYQVLRLEAGTEQPEALRLYHRSGWSRIECYGYFAEDLRTVCFEKIVRS